MALRPAGVSLISISGFLLGTQSSHGGVAGLRSVLRRQWEGGLPSSSYPSSDAARLFAVSCWGVRPNCSQSFLPSSTSSTRAWSPCPSMPPKGSRPKATFEAAFPSTRLLAGRITIATTFKYRHARPKVFVPLDESCVGLPRRIGASKEHDLKSKVLDGPGSVRRPLDLLRYETRSRQWLTRSRFSSA